VSAFIDAHRVTFGVAPICRVLSQHGVPIAPETYYARRRRPRSARAGRDERVLVEIVRVHTAARGGLYGARKVYHQLRREGVLVEGTAVARCTVERLMRTHGLVGVRRGRRVRTTTPDTTAVRPADLVKRQFTATAPNQLWVVDFTYVATWSGFVYVAFAVDVFSRMIVGWRAARTMKTDLPLDALDMALWHRGRGHGRAPTLGPTSRCCVDRLSPVGPQPRSNPSTTVRSTPPSNRSWENPPCSEPGATHSDVVPRALGRAPSWCVPSPSARSGASTDDGGPDVRLGSARDGRQLAAGTDWGSRGRRASKARRTGRSERWLGTGVRLSTCVVSR